MLSIDYKFIDSVKRGFPDDLFVTRWARFSRLGDGAIAWVSIRIGFVSYEWTIYSMQTAKDKLEMDTPYYQHLFGSLGNEEGAVLSGLLEVILLESRPADALHISRMIFMDICEVRKHLGSLTRKLIIRKHDLHYAPVDCELLAWWVWHTTVKGLMP